MTVTYYTVASSTGRLNFSALTSAIASALLGQLELDAIWDGFNDAQARSLKQSLDSGLAALSWNRLEGECRWFPGTQTMTWTSSPHAFDPTLALAITFLDGSTARLNRDNTSWVVRLVR